MAKPNPTPEGFSCPGTRKKGSNNLHWCSGAMPTPVSATANFTISSSVLALTVTDPPGFVKRRAFDTRFEDMLKPFRISQDVRQIISNSVVQRDALVSGIGLEQLNVSDQVMRGERFNIEQGLTRFHPIQIQQFINHRG